MLKINMNPWKIKRLKVLLTRLSLKPGKMALKKCRFLGGTFIAAKNKTKSHSFVSNGHIELYLSWKFSPVICKYDNYKLKDFTIEALIPIN